MTPWTHLQKLGVMVNTYNPGTGEAEPGAFEELTANQPRAASESQVRRKFGLKVQGKSCLQNDPRGWLLDFIHRYTYVHMQPMYIQARTFGNTVQLSSNTSQATREYGRPVSKALKGFVEQALQKMIKWVEMTLAGRISLIFRNSHCQPASWHMRKEPWDCHYIPQEHYQTHTLATRHT